MMNRKYVNRPKLYLNNILFKTCPLYIVGEDYQNEFFCVNKVKQFTRICHFKKLLN